MTFFGIIDASKVDLEAAVTAQAAADLAKAKIQPETAAIVAALTKKGVPVTRALPDGSFETYGISADGTSFTVLLTAADFDVATETPAQPKPLVVASMRR